MKTKREDEGGRMREPTMVILYKCNGRVHRRNGSDATVRLQILGSNSEDGRLAFKQKSSLEVDKRS